MELEELLRDEELDVRKAALQALVDLLDFFPQRLRRSKVRHCSRPRAAIDRAGMASCSWCRC